jgi:Ser/Thr protein kinase RdoA (MazF antagonist)
MTLPDQEWLNILSRYRLGRVLAIEAGGGTAAPKAWVQTERGRYLLRRRRSDSSVEEVVRFDHALIEALATAGLPVVAPERSCEGRTWARGGEYAYEVFAFVPGLERFRQGNGRQIAAAARILARFHAVTGGLTLPGKKEWPAEHHILTTRQTLREAIANNPGGQEAFIAAQEMLASADRLAARLDAQIVASLPQVIIHGDYTPANVLFRGEEVGGIFDFDWVSRQPRLIDVGEALLFFAFRRAQEINPDSIWSLVQTWEPDMTAARIFLAAYQSHAPLDQAEAEALPLFMWQTWLGVRIRAMRKVSPEDRLRILTEDAQASLRWIELNSAPMSQLALDTTR